MSPWDHEYRHASMCKWHTPKVWWRASVFTKAEFWGKNGKSKICLREELQVTMHIFFSRQIQYEILLLITEHPFWRWWVDNLKHSKENYFPKQLPFQSNRSACAWFQDQNTANNRNLFKHPMSVCGFCVWPFLPSTNHAKCFFYSFHCLALQRVMSMGEQTVRWCMYLRKLFALLSLLPLSCGMAFLKLSPF